MAHLDSMSPTSPGIQEKFLQRWELKTSWTVASARGSQSTLTTLLGLPGLSGSLPCHLINSPPGHDQLTALLSSSLYPNVQDMQLQIYTFKQPYAQTWC